MAKILFGITVADMRKSIGTVTYSRNKYGAYSRNRSTPANPQTTKQQASRENLTTLTQQWATLTEPQRQSWIIGAKNFPIIDVFGMVRILSPQSLFIGLNRNLGTIGIAPNLTLPANQQLRSFDTFSIIAASHGNEVEITWPEDLVPNTYSALFWITPNLSPGIYFAKKYYRISGYLPAGTTVSGLNIPGDFGVLLETLQAGMKIFVKAQLISTESGQAGPIQQASAIIS